MCKMISNDPVADGLEMYLLTFFCSFFFLQGLNRFYDQIIQAILRHVNFDGEQTLWVWFSLLFIYFLRLLNIFHCCLFFLRSLNIGCCTLNIWLGFLFFRSFWYKSISICSRGGGAEMGYMLLLVLY